MAQTPIGMGEQDQAERDRFENELKRIIEASNKAGLMLRVIGSLAFQMHCPKFGYIQAAMGRAYTDIDFAGYRKQAKEIHDVFASVLSVIESHAIDLVLVRSRIHTAVKDCTPPIVRQGPFILPSVKTPFLPPLKEDVKDQVYTLVLDLDETLVHFVEVSS